MTASSLAGRRVARMNGAGNKILVLDLRGGGAAPPTPAQARAIHRAPGLDYDQMMVLTDPHEAGTLAYVPIYNNDGSLAEACGNGTRCVADRLARETGAARLSVQTARGIIACERLGTWEYRVDMGAPCLAAAEIPFAGKVDTASTIIPGAEAFGPAGLVNMGNPHAVFFVPDLDSVDLAKYGPPLETHPLFPDKANISFAQIRSPDRIRLKVWERGVGATLACGSAACATLVAAVRRGLSARDAAVELPGGTLQIGWREADGHVLMQGPVEFEREIELTASMFA